MSKNRRHTHQTKQEFLKTVKRPPTWLWWGFIALLVYMPFHVLFVQWFSLYTGGLEIWKVAKDFVIILLAGLAAFYIWEKTTLNRKSRLWWLFVVLFAYGLLHLLFLLFADLDSESAVLGTLYNNRLGLLLIIGLAAGLTSRRFKTERTNLIFKTVLIVSGIVTVLGVVQFLLPNDFMEHLGYSFERGTRAFFGIDDKSDLPRIMSTLKDPNSLGAFLVVSVSLLAGLYANLRKSGRTLLKAVVVSLPIQLAALGLTFSRSAWLGLVVALLYFGWQTPAVRRFINTKNVLLVLFFVALVSLVAYPFVKDSYFAENVVFHSDETTTAVGSTEKHLLYIRDNAVEAIKQPLGHGPGTAGIVSIRNERGTVLTENYYVQIAYEVGVAGLALFIALNWLVYDLLRQSLAGPLRVALLASFWGLVMTNLLLHTWSNEAVATIWWLLAGFQIGLSLKATSKNRLISNL